MDDILRVENLQVHYPVRSGALGRRAFVRAVDNVSLSVARGETLGIVGESGSGKTTLGYALLGRRTPVSGRVLFEGRDMSSLSKRERISLTRDLQMIYQDPYGALNPRRRVRDIVGEPLKVHRIVDSEAELAKGVEELLELCGLPSSVGRRYPGEFSGGQRQRIVIARSLALRPKVIIADEPTSALDVSVQAQIINLLRDLQRDLQLTYVFISHNLSVVRHISHRVGIMYLGKVVELGSTSRIFADPQHPYSRALISAIPKPEYQESSTGAIRLSGELPSPLHPPTGCVFSTRCPSVFDPCRSVEPLLVDVRHGDQVACHLYEPVDPPREE